MTVSGGARTCGTAASRLRSTEDLAGSLEVRALGAQGLAALKRVGKHRKGLVDPSFGALVLAAE